MDVHIARQPVFDIHNKVFAYELHFHQILGLTLDELNGDRATTSLLSTTFLTEGIEEIAGNKPCFINFTEKLLVGQLATVFPKNKLVVEILETVPPSAEVLAACRALSNQGYILALDDFVYARELLPLIELVNIVKIDFQLVTSDEIERTRHRLARYNLKYLAEKVESYEELELARKLGFNYFQGYFFARPESLRITEIAANKANLLRLLAEVNQRQITVTRLEQIIGADVAITFKLLRYLNSAFFYLLQRVESVRQAIIYLGERETRRFVTLVIISELAADKPEELMRLSVVRGRFCELLAEAEQSTVDSSELFLLGLFSLLDALLDTPMARVMDTLPLSAEVKDALIHQRGPLVAFLDTAVAYEQGQTQQWRAALGKLRVNAAQLSTIYREAIRFAAVLD